MQNKHIGYWCRCYKRNHLHFIQNCFKVMASEFNQYIVEADDLPWWYTENSLMGFLSTGLTRKNLATVVLEYQCSKGKCGSKYGRADAWIKYNKTNWKYLVEAKREYVSAWT